MTRRHGLFWFVIAGVVVLIPVGFLAGLLVSTDRLSNLPGPPEPFVEPVQVIEFDERIGVAATLQWAEGPALYAPAWSGTVGRIDMQPGDLLETGKPIGSIDGVSRLAVATPEPLYRFLREGDRGIDVGWLHQVLVELGYLSVLPPDPELVSSASLTAIRSLAKQLGVGGRVSAFDPGWFLWMPVNTFEVASTELILGGQAPSPGAAVVVGPVRLVGITLQSLEGGPLQLSPGPEYRFSVGDLSFPLNPETATMDAQHLEELGDTLVPFTETMAGTVHRAAPLSVWAIPSAAIMSGASGQLCIWVESSASYQPIQVRPVSARAGITFVEPSKESTIRVLHNPVEILSEPSCP